MNAPFRQPVEIATPIDDAFAAYRNLKAAIALYDNNDSYDRSKAIEALETNLAAFWTSATYSNALGCSLLGAANRGEDIAEVVKAKFAGRPAQMKFECGLNTLVPLNPKASKALAEAYMEFGSWVEASELERRVTTNFRANRQVA